MESASKKPQTFSFQLDEFYLDLREDGRSISFLDKKEIEQRPFPGLRPFKTSEFQLFNGRDGQAEELINRLRQHHFLAVIGSSGTGKSSLIRAGLIPQLLAGYLGEAGTNWDIAMCRPGKDPVANLAVALARIQSRSNDEEKIKPKFEVSDPLLRRSIYGILEFNEQLNPPDQPIKEKSNLLIVVDQFEEMFRFNRDDLGGQDIENHFVNLLLKASANPDVSIYVIITMRSEFLGDCARYRGLPEAINEGQYLVPQLHREQIREVIEDPILIAGKRIAPGLVELLVNEIEESKAKKTLDQLPILQHALMRTYQEAMKTGATEITYEHYKATGGLELALSNHAQAKFQELGDGNEGYSFKQKIAKLIFQALTDASTDQKQGRRPTELGILYRLTASINASEKDVDDVVNHFRDTETSFIMPPSNTSLYPGLIMDISHESLMRQWDRLKVWVSEEAENGKQMIRLSEYQKRNAEGDKDFLEGKELQQLWNWYNALNPSDEWTKRYTQDSDASMNYLSESKKRALRKKKNLVLYSISACLIVLLSFYGFYRYTQENVKQQEAQKEKELMVHLKSNAGKSIVNEDRLQALFFTTEVLMRETDSIQLDSIRPSAIKYYLLPDYALNQVLKFSSDVQYVLQSDDRPSVYVWTKDSLMEVDLQTTHRIRAVQIKPKFIYYLPEELVYSFPLSVFADNDTSSLKLEMVEIHDSSLYFKRMFMDSLEKDMIGYPKLPKYISKIDGAYYARNQNRFITWGLNAGYVMNYINLFNSEYIPIGISMPFEDLTGASINDQNGSILAWGMDSTVKFWQPDNDTSGIYLPPALFKLKMQINTGVEMTKGDFKLRILKPAEYAERKKEYERELKIYQQEKN